MNPYRSRVLVCLRHRAALAFVLGCGVTLGLVACGDSGPKKAEPAKLGFRNERPDRRLIPEGESKIRTIVGEELEKLPGEAGKYARKEKAEQEARRQSQGWIRPVDRDFGERPSGQKLVAKFALRNPTKKTHVLRNITSSCSCQKIIVRVGDKEFVIPKAGHDPIPVPPGATGSIEAHLSTEGRSGIIFTEVLVETSDPLVPSVRLAIRVTSVAPFIIERDGDRTNSIDLGLMTQRSKKTFEFNVRSRDGKPFRVVKHSVPPVGMKLDSEPVDDSHTRWTVHGQLGPDLGEHGVGGTVTFTTDRKEGFELNVFALVMPAIRIEPATLAFGVVPRKKGGRKTLRLSMVDKGQTFEVDHVEIVDAAKPRTAGGKAADASSIETKVVNAPDKKSATIELVAPSGLERGHFGFAVKIWFKGKEYEPRTVQVFGHVR